MKLVTRTVLEKTQLLELWVTAHFDASGGSHRRVHAQTPRVFFVFGKFLTMKNAEISQGGSHPFGHPFSGGSLPSDPPGVPVQVDFYMSFKNRQMAAP